MRKSNWILILLFLIPTLFACTSTGSNAQKELPVKNIILLIGDGMGVSQLYAGMTANHGELAMERMKAIGLAKTYSASNYVTDSGAAGTAIATGHKTYNGAIGVDTTEAPIHSILWYAEQAGKATGLISTSSITHATPAAFIAHEVSRNNYEQIAADFLDTPVDVVIGGGYNHFAVRSDSVDLTQQLADSGYQVVTDHEALKSITEGKLLALTAPVHHPRYGEGRGNMLPESTAKALELLSQDPDGFFIMIEASQIDWGGHANDVEYVKEEILDLDRAVSIALDFADANPGTLVILTSDHETGGLGINMGDPRTGMVEAGWTTGGHTGVMVPVFAYGPQEQLFQGIMENTDIFVKMMEAFQWMPNGE